MKVAVYARYSSDNQHDASIADQLRICREFATRQGWTVVHEFTDHVISGAALLRSGFQALMRDALNRRFDKRLNHFTDPADLAVVGPGGAVSRVAGTIPGTTPEAHVPIVPRLSIHTHAIVGRCDVAVAGGFGGDRFANRRA
jgi:threonine dehydratase